MAVWINRNNRLGSAGLWSVMCAFFSDLALKQATAISYRQGLELFGQGN